MNHPHSHRQWRRLVTLSVLCVPMAVLGQPVQKLPPLPEDLMPGLRPILVAALAQSPQMIAHNIEIAQAEGTRIQYSAGLLPSLGTSVQYGSNTTTTSYAASTASAQSGFLYSIYANQPVYHWGALKARADIGKIGVRIAERQYADAFRQLVVALRAQYLTLAGKKIALRNAEFALQQAEEALALGEEKLKAKNISPGDLNGPRMQVDELRLGRDQTQEDLENSIRLFVLSSGQADFGLQAVPDEIPKPRYEPEVVAQLSQRFLQGGGDGTFAVLNLQDSIKQADLDYRIARVQLLPMFGLSAYISQQTQNSVSGGQLTQYVTKSNNYNVVANWSVFDGFATRGAKLAALSRKRSLERSLRDTVDQLATQVRDQEKQLGFSWRGLEIAQTRRDYGEGALDTLKEDIKLGRASPSAMGNTRMLFFQFELSLARARGEFLERWSQFVSTVGVDPSSDMIPERFLKDAK